MATRDPGELAADAASDFFHQIYTFLETIVLRFVKNFYGSFANVSVNRWTKVILSVVGYLIARPYIEALFKKMGERDRRKQLEKERKKKAEAEAGGKAKVSANSLRGGGKAAGEGKVLGEVENTDDELENEEGAEDEVDFATSSGVPEFADNARRRQKKHAKSLNKESKGKATLSEDKLMELLDWSDSEGEATPAKEQAAKDE
ncbi:uncharacterized protein BDW47DRAFT_129528 [Aspergillus candidus]|uniref:Trafficking PGA2-domain-containing protein n=1 Tax=Aspergillus candidus TaxID=41067 RepID=A0A2I2EZV1_ASPCN|nr:hypothetical protein BDW47DRAFT_129528 [Aspergillus candidus]PLB33906.1 hypothetical protein BDW47DRAFT_129528 [Aspergillus candidus]